MILKRFSHATLALVTKFPSKHIFNPSPPPPLPKLKIWSFFACVKYNFSLVADECFTWGKSPTSFFSFFLCGMNGMQYSIRDKKSNIAMWLISGNSLCSLNYTLAMWPKWWLFLFSSAKSLSLVIFFILCVELKKSGEWVGMY